MNDTYDLRVAEAHIEVHKFRGGAIVAATILALFIQTSVPVYFPKFAVIDLPLLITIYFGLSRRNRTHALGLANGSLHVQFAAQLLYPKFYRAHKIIRELGVVQPNLVFWNPNRIGTLRIKRHQQ